MKQKYKYKKSDKRLFMDKFSKFGKNTIAKSSGDYIVFYDLCYSCDYAKVRYKAELLKLLKKKDYIICNRKGLWVDLNKEHRNDDDDTEIDMSVVIKAFHNVVEVIKVLRTVIK